MIYEEPEEEEEEEEDDEEEELTNGIFNSFIVHTLQWKYLKFKTNQVKTRYTRSAPYLFIGSGFWLTCLRDKTILTNMYR